MGKQNPTITTPKSVFLQDRSLHAPAPLLSRHLHVDWLPLPTIPFSFSYSPFWGYSRVTVMAIALPWRIQITLGCLSALQSIHYITLPRINHSCPPSHSHLLLTKSSRQLQLHSPSMHVSLSILKHATFPTWQSNLPKTVSPAIISPAFSPQPRLLSQYYYYYYYYILLVLSHPWIPNRSASSSPYYPASTATPYPVSY